MDGLVVCLDVWYASVQVLNKIIHVSMINAMFSMISALLCCGMLVHVLLLV